MANRSVAIHKKPTPKSKIVACDRSGSSPKLPRKKYGIIYADPPWDYKGQTQHTGKGGISSGGAIKHYPTVKSADMKNWDISNIAEENCLLFLWATSPHLDQAIDLGKSWGFEWATVAFVWDKEATNPGYYTLSSYEMVLVFKRGKIPTPRGARNIRQKVVAKRGKHSSKPEEVRDRINKMFPKQKKLEMFARGKAKGWDSWGNEI